MRTWFLEIAMVLALVCACMCASAPENRNNQGHDMV